MKTIHIMSIVGVILGLTCFIIGCWMAGIDNYDAAMGWFFYAWLYHMVFCCVAWIQANKAKKKAFEKRIDELEGKLNKEVEK